MTITEFGFHIFRNNKKESILLTLLLLVAVFFEIAGIATIIPLIQIFFEGQQSTSGITLYIQDFIKNFKLNFYEVIMILFIFFLIRTILLLYAQYKSKQISIKTSQHIKNTIMERIFFTQMSSFENFKTGEIISIINKQTDFYSAGIYYFGKLYTSLITFIILFISSIIISWQSIILIGTVGVFVYLIGRKINNVIYLFSKKIIEGNNKLNQKIIEGLKNYSFIVSQALENLVLEKVKNTNSKLRRSEEKKALYSSLSENFPELTAITIVLLVLVFIYSFTDLVINEFLVLLILIHRAAAHFGRILSNVKSIVAAIPSYKSIENLLRLLPVKYYEKEFKRNDLNFNSIKITDLSFSYKKNKIFDSANVIFRKSKLNLIIGRSGVGKSTLVKLITGNQKPLSGDIFIDDIEINKLGLGLLRHNLGFIPQNTFLINGTIKENIIFYRPNIKKKRFDEVTKICFLDEFVNKLPEKYDSLVGEDGGKLSGGQIQRICLARALIENPKILVLDEATNALDKLSTKYIFKTLKEIKNEKIIIIISHEIGLLNYVDKIFEIKDSKITEK